MTKKSQAQDSREMAAGMRKLAKQQPWAALSHREVAAEHDKNAKRFEAEGK